MILHEEIETKVSEKSEKLQCDLCQLIYETENDLSVHKKKCKKMIKCDVCEKNFTQKFNMLKHKRAKHEELQLDLPNSTTEPENFQKVFEESLIGHDILEEKIHNTPDPKVYNENRVKNVAPITIEKRCTTTKDVERLVGDINMNSHTIRPTEDVINDVTHSLKKKSEDKLSKNGISYRGKKISENFETAKL